MERVKNSKLSYYAEKIACSTEPGLSSSQLMLTNGTYTKANSRDTNLETDSIDQRI